MSRLKIMITAKNSRLQHFGPDISSWAALVLPQPLFESNWRRYQTLPRRPKKYRNGSWDRQLGTIPLIKYLRTKKWQDVYCLSAAAPLLRLLQWLLATAATTAANRHPVLLTRSPASTTTPPPTTAPPYYCYRCGYCYGYCYGYCFTIAPLRLPLRLLTSHPSHQQDHPRRQMATTGRNGSTTSGYCFQLLRLLLPVATAAATAATATATATTSASAPDSPTRSPASTTTAAYYAAPPYYYGCYCLFLSKQYQR